MEKFYINSKEDLNKEELRTGKVSYTRLIKRYTDNNIILCNNINGLDDTIWDNIQGEHEKVEDIYQYYLCNLDEYSRNKLVEFGVIVSYSEMLELDVIMVDHFGTSWDYVMTDVEWSENFEEC